MRSYASKIGILLVLSILMALSFYSRKSLYPPSHLFSGNLNTYRIYHELTRNRLVIGNYHLAKSDVQYNVVQTITFQTLRNQLVAILDGLNKSGSYYDFDVKLATISNEITPITPYLIPKNKSQETILKIYNCMTTFNKYIQGKTGYIEGDYHPEFGAINFSVSGGVAFDTNGRSIGIDLGRPQDISALRLSGWAEKNRIRSDQLSIWLSDDNRSFSKYSVYFTSYIDNHSIFIDKVKIKHRYIKINCNLMAGSYTFSGDLMNIMDVFGPPSLLQEIIQNLLNS
jgi:hypothetical protein